MRGRYEARIAEALREHDVVAVRRELGSPVAESAVGAARFYGATSVVCVVPPHVLALWGQTWLVDGAHVVALRARSDDACRDAILRSLSEGRAHWPMVVLVPNLVAARPEIDWCLAQRFGLLLVDAPDDRALLGLRRLAGAPTLIVAAGGAAILADPDVRMVGVGEVLDRNGDPHVGTSNASEWRSDKFVMQHGYRA